MTIVRAGRALLAAASLLAVGGVPAAGHAAPTWRNDHVLLAVTAGPRGAEGFATVLGTQIADTGSGPRVAVLGLGSSLHGGAITATEGGGGPLRLTTTRDAGGMSAALAGPVNTLSPQLPRTTGQDAVVQPA